MANQNDMDYLKDQMQKGELTAAQANVLMIQIEGVRLVQGIIPRDIRRSLMVAVKGGELGHLKRDGHKPEAFFHINSRGRAVELRLQTERRIIGSSRGVLAINAGNGKFEDLNG